MSLFKKLLERHGRHHSHPSYLRFLKGAIGMMLDPENTESVFDIEDGLRRSASTSELLRFTARDPGVKTMIDSRYLRAVPDTARLAELPPGTLGREYVEHLERFGFDPNYYRKIEVRDETDYIMMRIRQTHDIWHVVTGFDTHPLGEIAIKATELAQTRRPMAAAICAGGVFRYMLRASEDFGHCIESIVAGYHLGLRAKPLLAMKWEELWDRPVAELRRRLDVVPLGARGGQLEVDLSPHSSLLEGLRGFDEISECVAELRCERDARDPVAPDDCAVEFEHRHSVPGAGTRELGELS